MRHILWILFLSLPLLGRDRAQGDCELGNQKIQVNTILSSASTPVMRSYPQCTVTVYLTGTVTLATLYTDDNGTPLANPFTASTTGHWFFYANNGRYDVKISGGGLPAPFTYGDIRLGASTSTGTVQMIHAADGTWTVYAPNGDIIPTAGSTCDGLPEAIAYAFNTTTTYNLVVEGGAGGYNLSTINCRSTVVFPAFCCKSIRVKGVTLDFNTAIGSNPCVTFDSMMVGDVDFGGTQVVNHGTGPTVVFKPVNGVPGDGSIVITDSRIAIPVTVNVHSPTSDLNNTPLIKFDISANTSIIGARFSFDEINGAGTGILITDPGVASAFALNELRACHIHSQVGTALASWQIGTSTAAGGSSAGISQNQFQLCWGSIDVAGKDLIRLWGTYNTFDLGGVFPTVSLASSGYAVKFESSSDFNYVHAARMQGKAGPSGSTYLPVGGSANYNRVEVQQVRSTVAVTPPGSGVAYRNQDFVNEFFTINGGTVSSIQVSADGVSYSDIGTTGGIIPLDAGSYVKAIYSVAPTMRKLF